VRDGSPAERPATGDPRDGDGVVRLRWMLEELRLGLFAQTIRTAYPVSEKRVLKAIDELRARPRPATSRR
jgi:ATP-dependent helicase HrpA